VSPVAAVTLIILGFVLLAAVCIAATTWLVMSGHPVAAVFVWLMAPVALFFASSVEVTKK
jgi:hypothetical protein